MQLRRYSLMVTLVIALAGGCSDVAEWRPASESRTNEATRASALQETGELPAINLETGEAIGNALAIDQNTAVVGPRLQVGNASGPTVRVFERRPDIGWFQTATLTGSESNDLTQFGKDVAVDGERILVGALLDGAAGGQHEPGAYVFEKDAEDEWVEVAILRPESDYVGNSFGQSVALSEDTAVVSDRNASELLTYQRSDSGTWSRTDSLSLALPEGDAREVFDTSVSLDGDALLVAAVDASLEPELALIWAFPRLEDGTWGQSQRIEHHRFTDDPLRISLSIDHDGGDAVVGCAARGCPTETYVRDPQGVWRSNQRLSDLRTRPRYDLGTSVSISSGVIVAGALDNDGFGHALSYVQRPDGSWSAAQSTFPEADIIEPASFSLGSYYGTAVATNGDEMMVGAPYDSVPGTRFTGSVVVFEAPTLAGMPDAVDDQFTGVEDTDVVLDVLANDTHPDQAPLQVVAVGEPEHGRIRVSTTQGGLPIYEPDDEFSGTDRLEYAVEGPDGLADEAQIVITVAEDNDPPETTPDYVSTPQGEAVVVDVLENDVDIEGDVLSVAAVADASNGTVSVVGGGVEYVPDDGYFGDDTFEYTARDERGAQASGRVFVTVVSQNEPPRAVDDDVEARPGHQVTIDALANDSDDSSDALMLVDVARPDRGEAAVVGDKITYQAPAPFEEPSTFSYTVRDNLGATADGRVTVRPADSSAPDNASDGSDAVDSGAESRGCSAAAGGVPVPGALSLCLMLVAWAMRRVNRHRGSH